MKQVNLPIKQRDVTYRRMHTLTYGELKTMTYAELQNKYYEVVAPKSKSIRLVEPIKEVTI